MLNPYYLKSLSNSELNGLLVGRKYELKIKISNNWLKSESEKIIKTEIEEIEKELRRRNMFTDIGE